MKRKWIGVMLFALVAVLTTYFLACGGGDGGHKISANEGGEYWFVGHYIHESSIGSTMDEIFNNTTIISEWGTLSLDNSTGQWTVYSGDVYDPESAPYGMARHRHRLTGWDEAIEEGYFNPSVAYDPPGEPSTGTYTLDGHRLLLNISPEDGFINGAFSLDYQSFVGTNMYGNNSEFIYAFKKPTTAPTFNPNGKYLLLAPYLEIMYATGAHPNSGVLNGTEGFSISYDFVVFDNALNNSVQWSASLPFMPLYDPITNALEGWVSDGPDENASIETSGLDSVSIRADGLMEMPGRFLAMGKGGSGLFAGSTVEEEEGGWHMVKTGSILELEASPTLNDVAGTWLFSPLEGKVEEGPDPGWGDGDERLNLYYPLMELTMDADGNTIGNSLANKHVFTGEVDTSSEELDLKVTLVQECYKPGTALGALDCSGGVTMQVFHINGVDAGGGYLPQPPIARFVLDSTHNLATLWMSIDQGGVPCDEENDPCSGDAMPEFQFGLGVKYK